MKRFSITSNGYDVNEVNRFIDIVINRLEKLNFENASYVQKIEKLNKQLEMKGTTDDGRLEKAILAVQETGERIKELAKDEARMIVDEAKNNANAIVHEALIKAEKTEQDRVLLEKNMRIYKERVKSLIEAELRIAEDLDKIEL